MAANPMPPLNWTCPVCGQTVPASQSTCPNCAGTGAPTTPAPPRPRPAPATPAPATPATPAPAAPPPPPPPQTHGSHQRYTHPLHANVARDENWVAHPWYVFLLWMLGIGGLAFLAWLFYGGFLLGWHANPCKDPCNSATAAAAPAPPVKTATRKSSPAPAAKKAARRQAQTTAPRQVQLSGSVDLVHHEAQIQTATPSAPPARPSTPEELDEATARWLEGGQRNP